MVTWDHTCYTCEKQHLWVLGLLGKIGLQGLQVHASSVKPVQVLRSFPDATSCMYNSFSTTHLRLNTYYLFCISIIFVHHIFSLHFPTYKKKKTLPHLPFILFYPDSLNLLVFSIWIHTEYMWPIQAAKQRWNTWLSPQAYLAYHTRQFSI